MSRQVALQNAYVIRAGEHACLFYESREALYHSLKEYLLQGFQANERVVLIACRAAREEIINHILLLGLDLNPCLDQGKVGFFQPPACLLTDPSGFDPDCILDLFQNEIDRALETGFAGLRFAIALDWLPGEAVDMQSWNRFENLLNEFRLNRPCSFLCLLSQGFSHHRFLLELFYLHPEVIIDGLVYENFYYTAFVTHSRADLPTRFLDTLLQSIVIKNLDERDLAYRQIARNLPGLVYRLFLEDEPRIIFINHWAQRITGYAENELPSGDFCPIAALILPEDRDRVMQAVLQSIRSGEPFSVEYRLRCKDGSTRMMLEQGTPVFGAGRVPVFIDGVISDITGQREAEETLQLQAQMLAQIRDAVIYTDMNGFILGWNHGAEKLYGYREKECLGKHVSFLYPQDQQEFLEREVIGRLIAQGQNRVEVEVCTKSAERLFVDLNLNLLKNGQGKTIGMIGYSRDITEKKAATLALRKRADQQACVIEFGQHALSGKSISRLFQEILSDTVNILGVEYAEIIQVLPDGEVEIRASTDREQRRPGKYSGGHPTGWDAGAVAFPADLIYFPAGDGQPLTLSGNLHSMLAVSGDLCVLIRRKQELYGYLCVHGIEGQSFNQDDVHFLRSMVNILGLAMDRKQSEEAVESYLMQMQILHKIDEAILAYKSPEAISKIVLHYLRQLIPCMRASVTLYQEDTQEGVILVVNTDLPTRIQAGTRFPSHFRPQDIDEFQRKEVHYVADILSLARRSPIEKLLLSEGVRSYMAVPLYTKDQLIGSLNLSAAYPDAFDPRQIELAHKVAFSLAVAIHDARLFELVVSSRAQLKNLTHSTVEVQEAERRRISRELHDHAGQALTALRISLDLIQNQLPEQFQSLHEELSQAAGLTSKTINEIRLLAADLRPLELDTVGLRAALEDLCEDFDRRTGTHIRFSSPILPDFSDTVAINLYRIVQEGLTNIVKHAGAQHAWVTIHLESSDLHLVIRDDGCGFDVRQTLASPDVDGGLGVIGIMERVDLMAGEIKITSAQGVGTALRIKVPWRHQ